MQPTMMKDQAKGVRRYACASVLAVLLLMLAVALCACGGSSEGGSSQGSAAPQDSTSGPAYAQPSAVLENQFDAASSRITDVASIDTATCNNGYVGAAATANTRLKLLITKGDQSYNYDMPTDGTPIFAPMNMGDGTYKIQIMQNTSGSSYAEIAGTTVDVNMTDPFLPYLYPNMFCDYSPSSECVKLARELASGAENQGDVVRAVYEWMTKNISYDVDKATKLASATGYVPNPDETLATKTGICFDYASLAAAMLRSLGIPCQIITGYVSPQGVYHAWNMVYIDGQWESVEITVKSNEWTRLDLTFAASDGGNSANIGDGSSYTDRYVY